MSQRAFRSGVVLLLLLCCLCIVAGCGGEGAAGGVDGATITFKKTADITEKWVTAANGNNIYVRLAYPSSSSGTSKYPAVVIVPGGLSGGTTFLDDGLSDLAERGYIVVTFNPQGRGSGEEGDLTSEGEEDFDGYVHQDDLKSVIEDVMQDPNVDAGSIGVVSYSYGITLAAGCLARHPELNVKFLIDYEGSSESYTSMGDPWLLDTVETNDKTKRLYELFGHLSTEMDPSPANVRWWAERQALAYIGSVKTAYLRIQSQWDHMQPPSVDYRDGFDHPPQWYRNKHAIDMINAATNGKATWTRVNEEWIGNAANAVYRNENPPRYYVDSLDVNSDIFKDILKNLIEELFALP
ncbi:MAG: prolyl oligopeptidase family serine peptidase [Thermodesulfovibrionales bacterium]